MSNTVSKRPLARSSRARAGTAPARVVVAVAPSRRGRRRPTVASPSTGKLKTAVRSERCAPSVFVALTGASGGTRRDRSLGDLRHARRRCAPAPEVRPDRDVRQTGSGPSRIPADERRDDDRAALRAACPGVAPPQPRGAEDRGDHQPGKCPRGVVEVDRRLCPRVREEVQASSGSGGEGGERREQRQREERHEQVERGTATSRPSRRRADDRPGIRDGGLDHAAAASRRRTRTVPRTASRRPGRSAGRRRPRRPRRRRCRSR